MIDVRRYRRMKDKGKASIVPWDGGLAVSFARYDVEDGRELKPEMQPIVLEQELGRREAMAADLAALDEVIAAAGGSAQ